jgi:hypothetical protein
MCVSCEFLNYKFGGGEMQLTGNIDKTGNKRNLVMFPKAHYNPLMASTTGAAGLIYTG